jgi:hypothetical protein
MAWRPQENLIEGELDNTVPGKVTGWIRFLGMDEPVRLELVGDFHRDIRGAKIRFRNHTPSDRNQNGVLGEVRPESYMKGFSPIQTGQAGDITAGLPPYDYTRGQVYIEWFSEENGRVVLELGPDQIEVVGKPIPWEQTEPVSRKQQHQNMAQFLAGLCGDLANTQAKRNSPV